MVSHRASALRLDENALAELEIAGAARPVTKAPLTAAQVVALLREIAPPAAGDALDAGQPTTFDYVSDDGAFAIDAKRDGGRWQVRITIDAGRERDRLVDHARDLGGARSAAAEAPAAAHPTPAAIAALRLVRRPWRDQRRCRRHHALRWKRSRHGHARRAAAHHGRAGRVGPAPALRRAAHPPPARRDDAPRRQPPLEADGLDAHDPLDHARAQSPRVSRDERHRLRLRARRASRASAPTRSRIATVRPPSSGRFPATVVTVEQMGISPEVQKLCSLTQGPRARHRPDRLGQVDDALRR